MSGLDGLEKSDIRDLLGKGWLTHDAMWFYHTCRQFGIEKANEINKAAIQAMAPIEMERAKRLLGIDGKGLATFDSLKDFMFRTLELILPTSVFEKSRFISPARGLIHWRWENRQCFAYKGMKQIGMIDGYSCGVMFRIGCWLDALGITYAMRPEIEGCLMRDKGACEGDIQIFALP
ncbi:MAG: DUF6125 family protein [Deltaproteobacteria bacterium]|nr:DUF6125 family protein [Deltaproteobacteria bacterium]